MSKYVLYFAFGIIAATNLSKQNLIYFGWAVFVCALIESISVFIFSNFYFIDYGYLGNRLHAGILLPSGLLFALVHLLPTSKKGSPHFFLIGLGALVILVGILLIRTRMALLAFFIILPLVLKSKGKKIYWASLLSCGAVALFLISFKADLLDHLRLSHGYLGSALGRLTIWKTSLLALQDHFLLGFGLGHFEVAYKLFQQPTDEFLGFGKSTIFAHNGVLQAAVEAGLVGMLLVFWGFFRIISANSFQKIDKTRVWVLSVIFLFALTAMVNYVLILPLSGLLLSGCLGFLSTKIGTLKGAWGNIRSFRIFCTFLSMALGAFVVLYGVSEIFLKREQFKTAVKWAPLRSEAWYQKALNTLRASDVSRLSLEEKKLIISDIDTAIYWNRQNPFFWNRKALLLIRFGIGNEEDILSCFSKALALAPHHVPFLIREGLFHFSQNRLEMAEARFEKSADLEPNTPIPFLSLGLLQRAKNNNKEAIAFFNKAKELNSSPQAIRMKSGSEYAKFLFAVSNEKIDNLINQAKKVAK